MIDPRVELVQQLGEFSTNLRVSAQPQEMVTLPVQVRTLQPLADSLTLVPQPRTVQVLVSRGGEIPRFIPTVPIDLARLRPSGIVTASLDLPQKIRLPPESPGEVTITLRRAGVSPTR